MSNKQLSKSRRVKRVRSKVRGTSDRPRLSVFRSNMHIYAQVIDDSKGVTIVSADDKEILRRPQTTQGLRRAQDDKADMKSLSTLSNATKVGKLLAEKAKKAKVKQVRFDRGAYAYHGRVKALAEGAREGGLVF